MIAGLGIERQLGLDGNLLWRLPQDLKSFKALTMGKPMVMGRKTFESIGKALPGRETIILTRDESYKRDDCTVVHSKEDLEAYIAEKALSEVMIVGGGEIYDLFLNESEKMYLSFVDYNGDADTYFPKWDETLWEQKSCEEFSATEKTLSWKLCLYSRKH
ncbi:hypothetical protein A9Q84_17755 [Halobacteriovorax marinus]|uniref:Dihydrofolate reductase n=1 Tax=Halobacteriovorax marinus TaxID=97084 RepID=A0A1Y5F3G4_9BACT|nr:hypothetical protein A9Q84_17755 [Halobacteriovorax marinus]